VSLARATVRGFTALFEHATRARRAAKFANFADTALEAEGEAAGLPPPGAPPPWVLEPAAALAPVAPDDGVPPLPQPPSAAALVAAQRVPRLLAGLWRLFWENGVKATYWLAVLDGIKCGERVSHSATATQCHLCDGAESHGRLHVFWRCVGAQAVRIALRAELARLGVGGPLRRRHLWLMQRPSRAIHTDIWRVVCLAAFAGMEKGRCAAWLVPRSAPHLPHDVAARIVRACALASFRAALADFAALGVCRPMARASVAPPRPAFFFVAHPHNSGALALRAADA
jgi:hypothetical protein